MSEIVTSKIGSRHPWRHGLVMCIAVSLGATGAGAIAAPPLHGFVTFSTASLTGATNVTTAGPGAFHALASEAGEIVASWRVEASRVTVNWTRLDAKGLADDPQNPGDSLLRVFTSPEEATGEKTYEDATLVSRTGDEGGSFLMRFPDDGISSHASVDGSVTVGASREATWYAGRIQEDDLTTGDGRLLEFYELVPGQPAFSANGSLAYEIAGNFTFYVYGGDLVVEADNETENYRSGFWWDNAIGTPIGARGAARDEHRQLLRLTLIDSRLTWAQDSGEARWTSREAVADTSGSVRFTDAHGRLVTPRLLYSLAGETVSVVGAIGQRLSSPNQGADLVESELRGDASVMNLSPSASLPTTTAPFEGFTNIWLIVSLIAVVALIGPFAWHARGTIVVRLRRRSLGETLEAAEEALRNRRPRRALILARRVIRRYPDESDAWFYQAAAFMQMKDYPTLLEATNRAPQKVRQGSPGVAYLLAYAHAHTGDSTEAGRWAARACADSELREAIRKDEVLWKLMGPPRGHSRKGVSDANAAYA